MAAQPPWRHPPAAQTAIQGDLTEAALRGRPFGKVPAASTRSRRSTVACRSSTRAAARSRPLSPRDSRRRRATVTSRFRLFRRALSVREFEDPCFARLRVFGQPHVARSRTSSRRVRRHWSRPGNRLARPKRQVWNRGAGRGLAVHRDASLYPTRGTVTMIRSSSPKSFLTFEIAVASDPSTTATPGQTESSSSALVTTSPA